MARKTRALGMGLALALSAGMFLVHPAQAAPTPTQCESDRKEAVAQQLADKPGGDVVDARTVAYENGNARVVLASPSSCSEITVQAMNDCPAGWACWWEDTYYPSTGRRLQFYDAGVWQNLRDWGLNSWGSYYNRRGDDAAMKNVSSSAASCYPQYSSISTSGGLASWRWIYLANTSANC
ncbi:hypothetical protein [Sinosporangium siamense]|uniref:Peptidase inhibitor family I36 n=1 Tax=Sinosporangium siamense TaxID=1367973 RepID=A0A919RNQ7_9ACTN|nr:hypothetical protein [Sinosporangium siamense]GII96522.1 hypothetical protein Ssi02_67530 [Sinosporangium siamense]